MTASLRSARLGNLTAYGSEDMTPPPLQSYRLNPLPFGDATSLSTASVRAGSHRTARHNAPDSAIDDKLEESMPTNEPSADDSAEMDLKQGSGSLVQSSEADDWATKPSSLRWNQVTYPRAYMQHQRASAAPASNGYRNPATGAITPGNPRSGPYDLQSPVDSGEQNADYLTKRRNMSDQNLFSWSTNSRLPRSGELAAPTARSPWPETTNESNSPSPSSSHWPSQTPLGKSFPTQSFGKASGGDALAMEGRLAWQRCLWDGQFDSSTARSRRMVLGERSRSPFLNFGAHVNHTHVSTILNNRSGGEVLQTNSSLAADDPILSTGPTPINGDNLPSPFKPYPHSLPQSEVWGDNPRRFRQQNCADSTDTRPFADQLAALAIDPDIYWSQQQQQQQQQQQHQQQQQQQQQHHHHQYQQQPYYQRSHYQQQHALMIQRARPIGPTSRLPGDGNVADPASLHGRRAQSPYTKGRGEPFGGSETSSSFQRPHATERDHVRSLMADQARSFASASYSWTGYAQGPSMSPMSTPIMTASASPFVPPGPSHIPFSRGGADTTGLDREVGHGVVSPRLAEFHRSNQVKGGRRWELRDIFDHMIEFAGDQHGSRFIQQKLETANSDERHRVFQELYPNALQLMKDVFGNYVIQKFFEHGDQTQKKQLANCMKGQVLELSVQVYGCRVVQKALEYVLVDQQASLIKELENNVIKCVKDQNGNHVVQKAIERIPQKFIGFIVDAFIGQVQHLATHSFGCRVVQRLLEHAEEPARAMLLTELHECAPTLILDQYGNYVTQHVIQNGVEEDKKKLIQLVLANFVTYAKQKFASNVVEKTILNCTLEERRNILQQICWRDDHREERGDSVLSSMIRDGYGNYVIQRLLETLEGEDYCTLVAALQPEIEKASKVGTNKQLENVKKKMERYGHHRNRALVYDQYQLSRMTEGVDSTAPTPSVTTDDTPSPRTASNPGSVPSSAGSCQANSVPAHLASEAYSKAKVLSFE